MNSTRTPFVLPFLFVPLFGVAWVSSAKSLPSAQVTTQLASGRVSALINKGGNIGVLATAEGALMVDSQFADVAPENEAAVRELCERGPVYLVNTHWHGDHTGGNAHFGGMAQLFSHSNVRRRLEGDTTIGGRVMTDLPAAALPTMTFESGLRIYLGGEEVRLVHISPGHTDGDSLVHFVQSNVIHMGDVYNHAGYPFIDLSSGGSVDGLIATLEDVLTWAPADARFIPGHGSVTGINELREYHHMVVSVVGAVREGAARGMSAEELLAAGVTSEYDERWDGGFIDRRKFVEAILADAGAQRSE
jgi:glyoxylase-like metal-dependent hydrolase (beta-lactamase superfamily II)